MTAIALPLMAATAPDDDEVACRSCGCTESRACPPPLGPCWWVEEDLCSACTGEEGGDA